MSEDNGVPDYCRDTIAGENIETDFQFICQHQERVENLIRSLQCLRDKRALVMLLFHIGNHCFRGMDILDDLMTRMKMHYFMSWIYTRKRQRWLHSNHANIAFPGMLSQRV